MEHKLSIELPAKASRRFLSHNTDFDNWGELETYYEALKNREIASLQDLKQWLEDRSELDAAVAEESGWRYIHMTRNTTDEKARQQYEHFVTEINPKISPYAHELNKKLMASPFTGQLDPSQCFPYLRSVRKSIELYRDENVPLLTQSQVKVQEFAAISGKMTVTHNEQELTLQQASRYLQDTDRNTRETVFRKIQERRLQDVEALDDLFDELVALRHQIALNAGHDNFRDYKFAALGRFDYGPEDCFEFHEAISREIRPIVDEIATKRKQDLGVEQLRPWDTEVDVRGRPPLRPFNDSRELIAKAITCFHRLRPYFGERLAIMKEMGHLDLDSRIGKAPGGYNYPLMETGVPFIFMNAANTFLDVKTIVHEGGHSVHSFLTRKLWIRPFKSLPAEIAELASMSMELFSMDHWDVFFDNEDDLKRAKLEQLRGILSIFPWVATVDSFQHWIYTHPDHQASERTEQWQQELKTFSGKVIDWTGIEAYNAKSWQKQLHIYEVPFYYIEYAMAQLGAVAMWKQFREDKEQALDNYMSALSLGYTRPIGEIYKTAGIKFDFSQSYVRELAQFVKSELDALL